jgi:hypothetical protein
MEDGRARFAHLLALRLGLTLGEVWALPLDEWVAWRAYFDIEKGE